MDKNRTSFDNRAYGGAQVRDLRLLEPILVTQQIKKPALILEHIDMSKTSAGHGVGEADALSVLKNSQVRRNLI